MDERDTAYTRRRMLKASAGTAVGATALQASGTVAAQEDAYGGYLSDDDSWSGLTADGSGMDEVTVKVGVQGNGGGWAFGPSAIYVEPGTDVIWEWTGGGGQHNVVHEEGDFQSELVQEEGHTFTHTFEEEGVYQYFCQPHKSLGMKGIIVVGEENVETELGTSGEETNLRAIAAGAGVFSAIALVGVATYHELFGEEE